MRWIGELAPPIEEYRLIAAARQELGLWPLDRGIDRALALGRAQVNRARNDALFTDKGPAALS